MSEDFWLGVAALPAAAIALGVAWVAVRWLLYVAGRAGGRVFVHGKDQTDRIQRQAIAATVFAAQRARLFTVADVAVIVMAGQDAEDRRYAMDRLMRVATRNPGSEASA